MPYIVSGTIAGAPKPVEFRFDEVGMALNQAGILLKSDAKDVSRLNSETAPMRPTSARHCTKKPLEIRTTPSSVPARKKLALYRKSGVAPSDYEGVPRRSHWITISNRKLCNPSTTPSAQGCHPCLRYVPLPMSPVRTADSPVEEAGIRTLGPPRAGPTFQICSSNGSA